MKRILNFILFCLIILISGNLVAQVNQNHVKVKGYHKSDGTYVQPHNRTAPNNSNRDNFSTLGNVNPYTLKRGHIVPDAKSYNFIKSNSDIFKNSSLDFLNVKTNTSYKFNRHSEKPEYKTTSSVNFRDNPTNNSAIIKKLKPSTSVRVLNSFHSYWHVYVWTEDKYGYIHKSLLEKSQSKTNTDSFSIHNMKRHNNSPVYRTTSSVNFRDNPTNNSAIIKKLKPSTSVRVLNSFHSYWHVYVWTEDKYGYIHKSLLKKD